MTGSRLKKQYFLPKAWGPPTACVKLIFVLFCERSKKELTPPRCQVTKSTKT